MSDVQMDTVQLPTSHSQHLNSGKLLGIGCYEWLWGCCIVSKWTAAENYI